MKKKILMLCMGCFLVSLTAKAQWVVSDPGNLAQGIINAAKNIVHTSSTATNMANSFQETVKIYRQGKEYYDGLRKVKNLVRDARKVQQTILMVGDITDIYVTSFERMLSDPYFTPEELSAIALGYTKLLEESAHLLNDLKTVVNENGLSMNDKERMDIIDRCYKRHVAKPQSGTVLHQQEHRGVLPARQETERPGPRDGTLRLTERTLLVIIPNPLSLCYCWL